MVHTNSPLPVPQLYKLNVSHLLGSQVLPFCSRRVPDVGSAAACRPTAATHTLMSNEARLRGITINAAAVVANGSKRIYGRSCFPASRNMSTWLGNGSAADADFAESGSPRFLFSNLFEKLSAKAVTSLQLDVFSSGTAAQARLVGGVTNITPTVHVGARSNSAQLAHSE